jgi:hypothetical protein
MPMIETVVDEMMKDKMTLEEITADKMGVYEMSEQNDSR